MFCARVSDLVSKLLLEVKPLYLSVTENVAGGSAVAVEPPIRMHRHNP